MFINIGMDGSFLFPSRPHPRHGRGMCEVEPCGSSAAEALELVDHQPRQQVIVPGRQVVNELPVRHQQSHLGIHLLLRLRWQTLADTTDSGSTHHL